MGDTSHLERMGRELKCPICLSLFNSAVSLSCNHVFCNACIVKSMKMDATCPVCKIPYHRREIRGAPHMDSLVSIYKNMEDASGVNMFVSQNEPSPSDKEKQLRAASIHKKNGKGLTSKRKEPRKTKETDIDALGPIVMKPSSQAKKRVQLLQNLSSESLTKPTESDEIAEKTVISLEENPCLSKDGNLEPFFWLRDDDDGESQSQLSESDQHLDLTPVYVPSFSDLKDSDHESPSKEVEQEKPNPEEMFDSEMFEWTQRPCSPEILPSPVKVQGRGEINLTHGKPSKEASSTGLNIGEKQDSRETYGTIIGKNGNGDENVKVKRATRSNCQSPGVLSGLNIPKEADGKQGIKRKRSGVKSSLAHTVSASNLLSLGTEIVGKGDQNQAHGSSDPLQSHAKKSSPKKRGRKSNANSFPKGLSGKTEKKTSKRSKSDSLLSRKVTQLHANAIQTNELNQDSTNKKKSTVNEGNRTMQVLEKCSAKNKSSLGASAPLRPCDGPPTNRLTCAFCQSSEETEASGEMAHYHRGESVSANFNGGSKVIHVHKNCAEWAPNVFFNNFTAVNLDVELTRSRRISCSSCGGKGAALGCYNKSCKKSFHVTCAKLIPECRWDPENFVMLCPSDASSELPCEMTSKKERRYKGTPKGPQNSHSIQVAGKTEIFELQSKHFHGLPKELVLCCSGLTAEEKTVVTEFTELSGVAISKEWDPSVTHVIASINENGACKRTIKFMMGILEGKWILSIDWIKACMKDAEYVNEEPYEISMDIHGIREGPYLGRQRALNKKPKLFNGLKFYIMGDFELAYKGFLQDLIVAAGGTILRRRPISNGNEASTIIVFSVEPSKNKTLTKRRSDAEVVAKSARARSASSSWVLDSIAGCKILDLT